MPARNRTVVVLAHCHLNVNTKVHGLAEYGGVRAEVLEPLIAAGHGIVQLPCPEASFLGMKRWGMTREQYDTPAYRRHCRSILGPVVDTLVALAEDGCRIESVLGVDGSPTCGVNSTCFGYSGGEIATLLEKGPPGCFEAPGRGVLMEVLGSMLDEVGLSVEFQGVAEGRSEEE